ncbi:unnamed protein product [Phytophthora fragariaefolia]|uniref:Unnamed protein product n=1 Tax=Phytophthora fragariaefolia TaxID=1490495 RepID=A0A9W7CT72_9STRA|nr:unnamed protein product [Phytophthora fragariaefolia]
MIVVAPNKRSEIGIAVSAQMGANYARMEVEGQPSGGWIVDTYHRSCGCNYFYAFRVCVHVLFAVQSCDHLDSQGREVLVSRKKRKRGAPDNRTNNPGGRPALVGPALTF